MILFSDLHLRPESEDVCFAVLDEVQRHAEKEPDKRIVCLGDVWHVRYAVPVRLLNRLDRLFHAWKRSGITIDILPGNHDQVDVAGESALEIFGGTAIVHSEPDFDGQHTWLPYRKDPQTLADWIAAHPESKGSLAFLHHGVVGAWTNEGTHAGLADGIAPEALGGFRTVFCGHWHRHQQVANAVFVGSQWQTRADEAGEQKGCIRVGPDGSWRFLPMKIGKRFHRAASPSDAAEIQAGDVVRVPAGTSQATVAAFQALGVEVFAEAAVGPAAPPRLGTGAPLRVQAERYVALQQIPEGLDAAELMAVFDDVVGG